MKKTGNQDPQVPAPPRQGGSGARARGGSGGWRIRPLVLRLTKIAAGLILFPFFRIRTEGVHHLPEGSAFVLLPKHRRWEDIPLLALSTRRKLHYMAKYELFINPLLGSFLSSLGGIPLNRGRPWESRRSFRTMLSFLEKGEGIVIFPEGTYYRDSLGPGHPGLVRMVRSRIRVPFIPVGITYSRGKGRTLVTIRFGPPIDGTYPEAGEFLERIMSEIGRLSGLA